MSSSVGGSKRARADYGLDAPGVIRNLVIVAVVGVGLWAGVRAGFWAGRVRLTSSPTPIVFYLAPMAISVGISCALMAAYMAWDSNVGKLRERERLLDNVAWIGAERVLDIGCGRGLMLIGAAHRAPGGHLFGVDIWQAEDLSGNHPTAPLENARLEGVSERVHVETADMRQLPFRGGSFDVIVSCSAIHNLYNRTDRAQAIAEMVRVLAPGGSAILDDIRHIREYESVLRASGIADVRLRRSVAASWILAVLTLGRLFPGSLVARKSAIGRA